MNSGVLFIVTSDPRTSPRAAEAIRIAAGVGAWQKADVTLYLRNDAVLALAEFSDDLKDGDSIAQYLPQLGVSRQAIYVRQGATNLKELGAPAQKFTEITDAQLAALAAKSKYVLRF